MVTDVSIYDQLETNKKVTYVTALDDDVTGSRVHFTDYKFQIKKFINKKTEGTKNLYLECECTKILGATV